MIIVLDLSNEKSTGESVEKEKSFYFNKHKLNQWVSKLQIDTQTPFLAYFQLTEATSEVEDFKLR